ncbi:hypothetical protein Bca101_083257 [Brassica carinata]
MAEAERKKRELSPMKGANKKWHGGRLGGVMVVAVMGIMDVMERSTIYVASSIPVKLATLTNMRYTRFN